MSSSFTRQQLEAWLKTIKLPDNSNVLDVGGAQLPVKGRLLNYISCKFNILDLEQPHKGNVPDYIANINVAKNSSFPDKDVFFDIIFCLEVMEYIWNPVNALEFLYDTLKLGGTLYISFPFVYPHHNPEGKDYLRYTRWGAEKLLKEAGFEIEEIVPRISGSKDLEMFYGLERMRPSKNYQGHNEVGYLIKCKKL